MTIDTFAEAAEPTAVPTTFARPKQSGRVAGAGSLGAELIDSVLLKLQAFQNHKELGSLCVGITSADGGVGVSTIAAKLATQAAGNVMGNVLLIDANATRPNVHKLFRLKRGPGINDYLSDGIDLNQCIQATSNPDLHILSWGNRLGGAGAISPLSLQPLFDELRTRYQMVVVDLPAIEGTGHGLFFANQTDGVVLVLDGNVSRTAVVKQLSSLLSENWIEVIGAIMNRQAPTLPKWLRKWF